MLSISKRRKWRAREVTWYSLPFVHFTFNHIISGPLSSAPSLSSPLARSFVLFLDPPVFCTRLWASPTQGAYLSCFCIPSTRLQDLAWSSTEWMNERMNWCPWRVLFGEPQLRGITVDFCPCSLGIPVNSLSPHCLRGSFNRERGRHRGEVTSIPSIFICLVLALPDLLFF